MSNKENNITYNNIYMAGAGGMLGEAFYEVFNEFSNIKCTDIDTNEDWLTHLDFRSYEDYMFDVSSFRADYLFHLGAFTDLEYCELNIDETYKTNYHAVKNAVKIANEMNIPLLYISTAGIFNGKKSLYNEKDIPDPICHYAKSKYKGELYVQNNAKSYLICRAGWMMGGGAKKDKKFINKIIKQINNGSKILYIVNDKLGTPTYTHDFANNVKLLIQNNISGLFNMVCQGVTSRIEVAKEIIRLIGKESEIDIVEVESDFFKDEYFAERPRCERLENYKLNQINLDKMRHWKIALKEYLKNYY
tara:strand:- start:159 stop:1070 length:912 start_codon:yes stop_codon:yes gene_type:complete